MTRKTDVTKCVQYLEHVLTERVIVRLLVVVVRLLVVEVRWSVALLMPSDDGVQEHQARPSHHPAHEPGVLVYGVQQTPFLER